MQSFSELAKKNQFSPIRTADGELAGFLHLEGKETRATLNSKSFHHFDDDENGWFDLQIEDHRGSKILLHNALIQSKSMPGSALGKRVGSYTSEIFPNTVILGTENLRKDQTLHQLSFELEGAENFFVYDTIEHHFYGEADKQSVLKTIRKSAWKPPKGLRQRSYSNDPTDVYIFHRPKRYLEFDVDDMRVRVWHARSQSGMGWTGHQIKITPVISLIFKQPIQIGEALDRIWTVKGFFDQLALRDLRIIGITFSKFKKGWPAADVYLANEAQEPQHNKLDIHPSHVPFSRWNERRKFQKALQKWLEFSQTRRFFRAAVRLSLIRLEREIDPTLITFLMAGIESLPELSGESSVSKEMIKKMAAAAHKVNPATDLASITGLLGTLGRTSPKQRLRKVAKKSFISDIDSDIDAFTSAAIELRNQVAHGRDFNEIDRTAAGYITQVLAYLCVAYDLQCSDIPSALEDSENRNILAISRMNWSWAGYRMIGAEEV